MTRRLFGACCALGATGLGILLATLLQPPRVRYTVPQHAQPTEAPATTPPARLSPPGPRCERCATEDRTMHACAACGHDYCTDCLGLLDFTRPRFFCPPCLERVRLA